jgi:hypothetical protein
MMFRGQRYLMDIMAKALSDERLKERFTTY